MKKAKRPIDVKKELNRVRKKLDEIEEDPKVLEEAEQFQREISYISVKSLLKQFNI